MLVFVCTGPCSAMFRIQLPDDLTLLQLSGCFTSSFGRYLPLTAKFGRIPGSSAPTTPWCHHPHVLLQTFVLVPVVPLAQFSEAPPSFPSPPRKQPRRVSSIAEKGHLNRPSKTWLDVFRGTCENRSCFCKVPINRYKEGSIVQLCLL